MSALLAVAVVTASGLAGLVRERKPDRLDEPLLYANVHAELVAGATLRRAFSAAAHAQKTAALDPLRAALAAHRDDRVIAAHLRSLPVGGKAASVAFVVASESGGRAAPVFLRLAERTAQKEDCARQRHALTSQARVSAMVVCGLPVLWLALGGWGRLADLVAAGGLWVAVIGLALQAVGASLIWRLAS